MSFYDNRNGNLWIHTHSLHVCLFLVTQSAILPFCLPIAHNKELLYSTIIFFSISTSLHSNDVFINYKASYQFETGLYAS